MDSQGLGSPAPAWGPRRRLEVALGLLWLLDAALQFQPAMFSKGSMVEALGMANMGLPATLSGVDYRLAGVLAANPVLWNSLLALLQVAIGAGLVFGRGRSVQAARVASVGWGVAVWVVGEGFGGVLLGGMSLLVGAPGAAVVYSLVTVAIWPPATGAAPGRRVRWARWSRRRDVFARISWAALWVGTGLLELAAADHAAGVPAAQVIDGGFGEPGFVATMDRSVGHLLAGAGLPFAATLAAAAVLAGVGVLHSRSRRAALLLGIAIAVFVGVAGQDLGGILTGSANDPGTGPVLVLLALSLWPSATGRRQVEVARPAGGTDHDSLWHRDRATTAAA
ncbi:MAG: hypothetical protein ACRDYY_10020 [Acidimicrobiales bacterium]